jgi:copper resistance protein D
MIDSTWLVLRAAALVLTLQATGMSVFGLLFHRVPLSPAVRRSAARTAWAAVALVGMQLLLEPAHLALEWSAITDPAMLRLAADSGGTRALAVRGLGLLCILAAIRAGAALRLAGIAFVLTSFALSGHTVAHEHRAVMDAILIVHVAIVAFWLGALPPLRLVLLREATGSAVQLLSEFSQLAVWLVPVIALAGLSLALLLLPDVAALAQPYGLALLAKVALFALLMGIAGLNRLRLVPALTRGDAGVAASLARVIGTEWLLICGVLAVTAVMTGSFSPD